MSSPQNLQNDTPPLSRNGIIIPPECLGIRLVENLKSENGEANKIRPPILQPLLQPLIFWLPNIRGWKVGGLWRHEFALYEYKPTSISIL